MSKPNSIYWRTAGLIALTLSVTPVVLYAVRNYSWPPMIFIGVIFGSAFSSTTVAAAWASFGPKRLLLRLPLALLWAALVGLSMDITNRVAGGSEPFGYFTLMTSVLWLAALVPFWIVSFAFGLKLRHQKTAPPPSAVQLHRQFGIRQLMIFTAFIAVVLGIGRWQLEFLSETLFTSFNLIWVFLSVSQIAISVPLICATMLPRYVPAGVIISLLLIAGVTAAQVSLGKHLVSGLFVNEPSLFTAMNLSSVVWVFLFAAVVRFSGYHFGVPDGTQGALEK
jgi:hypothetical protein